jgi:hypothetical protein
MQIRCTQCHKPFALSKEAVHSALDEIAAENYNHYNATCPHCSRSNRVPRKDLMRAAPDWKQENTSQPSNT